VTYLLAIPNGDAGIAIKIDVNPVRWLNHNIDEEFIRSRKELLHHGLYHFLRDHKRVLSIK
jgi:hypothetical protein